MMLTCPRATWLRRAARVLVAVAVLALPVVLFAAHDQGYVPASQLPPIDAVPAGPLVLTAYAFVWVALAAYVFTLWRRLGKVERELSEAKQALLQPAGRR